MGRHSARVKLVLESLEERLTPADYFWIGAHLNTATGTTFTAPLNDPLNWITGQLPDTQSDLTPHIHLVMPRGPATNTFGNNFQFTGMGFINPLAEVTWTFEGAAPTAQFPDFRNRASFESTLKAVDINILGSQII